jgi:hypothetical protein
MIGEKFHCTDSWLLESNGKKGAVGFFSDHKSSPREQIIPPEPARTCQLMYMTGSKKYSPVGTKAQPRVGLDL